jgi:hypothetical protein
VSKPKPRTVLLNGERYTVEREHGSMVFVEPEGSKVVIGRWVEASTLEDADAPKKARTSATGRKR